jgi:hypothetical protein
MDKPKPKKKLKINLRKTPKPSGASPELLNMLKKLADWNPKSNEAVLEVANRLAQAAREQITPDLFKKPDTPVAAAMEKCKKLIGHTLTRFNGISDDHDYITDATVTQDNSIILHSVHMFKRNRVGELAASMRMIYVHPGTILADRTKVTGKKNHTDCPIPGYTLDTPDAAVTFRKLGGLIECLSKALPTVPKRGKK